MISILTEVVSLINVIWILVIVSTLVIEVMTADLTTCWFTVGAIIALILSFLGVDLWIQFLVFFTVSLALLLTLGRVANRYLRAKQSDQTNIDACIGKEVLVLKDADDFNFGEGRYQGLVWTIVATDGEEIKAGSRAKIIAVSGNKLIVTKII